MKRFIIALSIVFIGIFSGAQENQITALGQDNPNAIYRLYPTTNMWTFLKLNTADGRICKFNMTLMAQIDLKYT